MKTPGNNGGALLPVEVRDLWRQAVGHVDAGRHHEALALLQRADAMAPDCPQVLEELAEACRLCGNRLAALKAYDRLVELHADTAATWLAMADTLVEVGEHAQALGAYRESLRQHPGDPAALHNLGRAHYRLGELDEARRQLERSAAQSDTLEPWLNLAVMMPGCPSATPGDIHRVRTSFGRRLAAATPAGVRPRVADATGRRRISIGYLGAFFDRPNYMKAVWPLINHHDRETFDIHLLSDCPVEDIVGYQPKPADRIHDIRALDNPAARQLVEAIELDILVDLNGYSTPPRLGLFAYPVAPVALAWFNMYATSGLTGIDGVIGDAQVFRPGDEAVFSETVYTLPRSYLTFRVDHPAPPVVEPPCVSGGPLTFGSLASQYKLTDPVIDAWAAILRRSGDARLVLGNATLRSPCNREYLTQRFERRGISAGRIDLLDPADHVDFLAYYNRVDVALDPFPYNGGTTTMEAIWQGVPVLTFRGDRWASRTSASILCHAGLETWVADNADDYVDMAVNLAQERATEKRLVEMRPRLREHLLRSGACDAQSFTHAMEALFIQRCRERPP